MPMTTMHRCGPSLIGFAVLLLLGVHTNWTVVNILDQMEVTDTIGQLQQPLEMEQTVQGVVRQQPQQQQEQAKEQAQQQQQDEKIQLGDQQQQLEKIQQQQREQQDEKKVQPEKGKDEIQQQQQQQQQDTSLRDINGARFAFALDNLQDDATLHRCGVKKCFYPLKAKLATVVVDSSSSSSRTNASNSHPLMISQKVGYVAGAGRGLGETMLAAYNFSKVVIEDQFGLKQPALKPPETIPLSLDFAKFLNKHKHNDALKYSTPKFTIKRKVHVQIMERLNEEVSLFWGCQDEKAVVGWNQVDAWLSSLVSHQPDTDKVLTLLADQTERLDRLLKAQPCLYYDFQFFVQHTGHIVMFDVDRCFHRGPDPKKKGKWTLLKREDPPVNVIRQCQRRMETFLHYITNTLKQQQHNLIIANSRSSTGNNVMAAPSLPFSLVNILLEQNMTKGDLLCDATHQQQRTLESLGLQPRLGYQVGSLDKLQPVWKFWQQVQQDKKLHSLMEHLYLVGPPEPIPPEVCPRQSNQTSTNHNSPSSQRRAVQLVQNIPDPVSFDCSKGDLENNIKPWLRQVVANHTSTTDQQKNKRMIILQNFLKSWAQLWVLLEHYPCL